MEESLHALNISDGEEEPIEIQGEIESLSEDLSLCLVGIYSPKSGYKLLMLEHTHISGSDTELDGRQQTLLVITYWAICYGDNRQEFSRARDGSLCIPPFVVADAFTAEALVCETAITFASDLGFSSVQVEGDSLSIIKKLNVATMDRSLINPIISDIHKLRGLFDNITFSYVGRKGNMVAHELVKLGTQFSEPMYWMEEELVSVERLVLRDLPP
ncbi:hypothetical protein V6N11_058909 [Hibiscus sabdariffa]|uniref:RNase H type-1 domain-containing protein n=1 Tax=Hibiscus sabdariffa TaxID=183260 RepID=A0ABR2U6C0_9ROSI